MINKYIVYVPAQIKLNLIKNKNFWLILNFLSYNAILNTQLKPYFNTYTRTLQIVISQNATLKNLVNIFINLTKINLTTIKFKGKGFKIVKNIHTTHFKFNFSHPMYMLTTNTKIFKLNKNKIVAINDNMKSLSTITRKILNIRQSNVYTKNGLRVKRQILYRRKGKTLNT